MPSTILNNKSSQYSSISDHQGKLLFVTNNEIVYNRNLEPMPNAETGIQYNPANTINLNSLIVPRPGTEQCYIFLGSSKNNEISYVVVDMAKNNGLGDVVQKAMDIHIRTSDKIVATGNCSTFWLFVIQTIEEQLGKNRLLRFKIDKNGLEENPDTVNIEGIDYFSSLTFSTDGKSLVFHAEKGSGQYGTVLCEFDNVDGTIRNPLEISMGQQFEFYEFSKDCSKLYASRSSFTINSFELYQYDISLRNSTAINGSKVLIYKGDENSYVQEMRLSPHGNIICQVVENGIMKTGSIDFPDKQGLECTFRKEAINVYFHGGFANFVSTFLSPQFDENFDISAGNSGETCSDTQLFLGEEPSYDIEYKWWPEKYLSNTTTSNPTFIYNDTISVKTDLQYILEGEKGYCYNSDTITITVHPDLDASVFGSKSVCPLVEEVDYWAKEDDHFRFE